MHIVMVASECAPIAKVGGLADVVGGLAKELAQRDGHRVEVVVPKYKSVDFSTLVDWRLVIENLSVPYFGEMIPCRVFDAGLRGAPEGLRVLLIEPQSHHSFFERDDLYGHPDDGTRYAFFCRATLELMRASGRRPDILHCHDWQTGLVPVLLYERFAEALPDTRAVFTLHNLHHQGVMGYDVLQQVHLDAGRLDTPDRLAHHHGLINLLKGGIVYANAVTTVSRTYAHEIRTTDNGCGLQDTLAQHAHKLHGILNGIDRGVWNPTVDPHLRSNYGPTSLQAKYDNKAVLRERLGLVDSFTPIVAVVSRLDQQKGCHLIRHALFSTLRNGGQFVLLGVAPDPAIAREFEALKAEMEANPNAHLELRFDDELAHQIYAGAEIIAIPSRFEPCGLTQMIALAYGTVPVVRATGGLAETVFDANHAERDFHEVNGYTFDGDTPEALDGALHRALGLWHKHPDYFRKLQLNGMRYDYSWREPANRYLDVYAQAQR